MEPADLLWAVRDVYVEQFRAFEAKQSREAEARGARFEIEVALQLASEGLHRRLFTADGVVVRRDGAPSVVEMEPIETSVFEPMELRMGEVEMTWAPFDWQNAGLFHDAEGLPNAAFEAWFDLWLDVDGERFNREKPWRGRIHSARIEESLVIVDLGTAEVDALLNLMDVLAAADATRMDLRDGPWAE